MNINILTIFPEIFNALNSGVVSRSIKNKSLKLNTYDIRKNAVNKHNHVDAKPYGGGEGMVIMAEPVVKSLNQIDKTKLGKVIYLSPQGKKLNQKKVVNLSKLRNITLICGRYEGIDQRVRDQLVDREISVGDYVLTNGSLAASVLVDSVARHVPGVLGDGDSLIDESFEGQLLSYPQYTRPNEYRGMSVPEVLLSGNHSQIEHWRNDQRKIKTRKLRPDLLN